MRGNHDFVIALNNGKHVDDFPVIEALMGTRKDGVDRLRWYRIDQQIRDAVLLKVNHRTKRMQWVKVHHNELTGKQKGTPNPNRRALAGTGDL